MRYDPKLEYKYVYTIIMRTTNGCDKPQRFCMHTREVKTTWAYNLMGKSDRE